MRPSRWSRSDLWRVALGLAVTGLFVWLVARQVQTDELALAAGGAQAGWIVIALLLLVCGFSLRVLRWHRMLQVSQRSLRWQECAAPLLASFALNNVLPLRAGDVLRVVAFNERLGTSTGGVAATVLLERLLDLAMILCALGLGLAAFGVKLDAVFGTGGFVLLAVAFGILALLLRPSLASRLLRRGLVLIARLRPHLAARLAPEVERGIDGLLAMTQAHVMGRLLLLSAAVWCIEGLMFWAVAQSLPALAAPQGAWLAFPVATLSTLVPSSPGYVGTFDFFAVLAMGATGNATAAATAFAILIHLVIWLPVTLVGLGCLLATSHGGRATPRLRA